MQIFRNGKNETAIFNGIRYRRYPESEIRSDRVYFSTNRNGKTESLHVAIWEHENGKVPEGFHIHHKDGNPLNNNIENLECIDGKIHISEHSKKYFEENKTDILEKLEKIRPLTKEWHASEEGIKWHSENAKKSYEKREPKKYNCIYCNAEFESTKYYNNKFCSNNCKSAYRRLLGVDDVYTVCDFCGKEYKVNKYNISETCSRSCANRLRHKRKKQA